MRRKSFGNMQCPAARGLERIGDLWSILIIRDALHGLRRFDEFQQSLGIAPNTLSRRLDALVDAGVLERREYSQHPPRSEYTLTERGRDFRPIVLALIAWGNKHFTPDGKSVLITDKKSGAVADPVLVDRASGHELCEEEYGFAPGPTANERTRRRLAYAAGERASTFDATSSTTATRRRGKTEVRHV